MRVSSAKLAGSVYSRKIGTGNFPEIWGFEIHRFPENSCRDPGTFFLYFKGFSGTDIYHSDVNMRSCKVSIFFLLVKIYFSKFPKFFTTKYLGDQKVFPYFVEKHELSSSKQHKKMLKVGLEIMQF